MNTIDDDYINNCKIITFSRNPYTRIPSTLKYIFGLRNIIIDNNTSYIDIYLPINIEIIIIPKNVTIPKKTCQIDEKI